MSDSVSSQAAPVATPPLPVDPITSDALAAATLAQSAQQSPADPTSSSRRAERAVPIEVTPDILPLESSSTATESAPKAPEQPTEQGNTSATGESEPRRELEPETEKVVEMMEKREITAPKETVVGEQKENAPQPRTIAKPVVILPLTQDEFEHGKSRSVKNSIRWLYQFCVRQIDRFALQAKTLVLYREKP